MRSDATRLALIFAALCLAVLAVACGGGDEQGSPTASAYASPAATKEASPTLVSPSPSEVTARTWHDVDDIVAAAGECQEYLVAGWFAPGETGEKVRTQWLLPRLGDPQLGDDDEPHEVWLARIERAGNAANVMEDNGKAIVKWLFDKYGSSATTSVIESMGKEPDWTPEFWQCVAAELGVISVTPAATPKATATPVVGAIGGTLSNKTTAVTVNSVDVAFVSPNPYTQPEAGNHFIVVDVTIEAIGSEVVSYNELDFEVGDAESYRYESGGVVGAGPDVGYGDLAPGEKIRGLIAFEIPDTATGLQLLYAPTGGQVIARWNLGP